MSNELFYARQISPENQDPSFADLDASYFAQIICEGNLQYESVENPPLLRKAENAAEDAINVWNDSEFETENELYAEIADMLTKDYATEKHPQWTAEEAKQLTTAYHHYVNGKNYSAANEKTTEEYMAEMLTLYMGERYETTQIHGATQGEWQTIYYPFEQYTDEGIEMFETLYFNTGTQWIVHDDEYPPEAPEDINGYSIYCCSSNPRKELAEAIGCSPDKLVMYEVISGVTRQYTPNKDNPSPDGKPKIKTNVDIDR